MKKLNFNINKLFNYIQNVNIHYILTMASNATTLLSQYSRPLPLAHFLQPTSASDTVNNIENTTTNKRALELEPENIPTMKKQKLEDVRKIIGSIDKANTFLCRIAHPNHSITVYSHSALVKKIDNPYFLNKLKTFIREYHNRTDYIKTISKGGMKIHKYGSAFSQLVADYKMAYCKDIKTDDELWTEFTNISSNVKYDKTN